MARIERGKIDNTPKYKQYAKEYYQGIMSGISYIIPLIVAGGISMGLLNLIFGYDFTHNPANESVYLMYMLTGKIMAMMVPLFTAYIAYGIAGKPGLIPGLVGGIIMQGGSFGDIEIASGGFLGAIILGGFAGFSVNLLKQIKVHRYIQSVKTIIFIPLIATALVGIFGLFIIAPPMAFINESLMQFLESLNGSSLFLVGAIMGIMAASDMGGPINKAAYLFAISMWAAGDFTYYAAFTLAKCIPGIVLGISVFITSKTNPELSVYSEEEQELSVAAIIMGLFGITEGAIPYAAKDPLRTIFPLMIACALGSGLVMMSQIEIATGAGGSFLMLPLISEPLLFIVYSLIAITIGVIIVSSLKIKKAKQVK